MSDPLKVSSQGGVNNAQTDITHDKSNQVKKTGNVAGSSYSNTIDHTQTEEVHKVNEVVSSTLHETTSSTTLNNHSITKQDNNTPESTQVATMFNKVGLPVNPKSHLTEQNSINFLQNGDINYNVEILSHRELPEGEHVPSHVIGDRAFITMNIDGNNLLIEVDVNELSDKLLMNKDKLADIINNKDLFQYIDEHPFKFEKLPQIMNDYAILFNKAGNNADPKTLMKIVKSFHKADVGSQDKSHDISLKEKYNNIKVVVGKDSGEVRILNEGKKEFAKSSFGVLYKVNDFVTQKTLAMKEPNLNNPNISPDETISDLENEVDMIRLLNSEGPKMGIMDNVWVKLGDSFVMRYMDSSSDHIVRTREYTAAPPSVKVNCCYQIIEGNIELERRGVVHLDQKPQNVLMAKHVDGSEITYEAVISDYGGATFLGDGKTPVTTTEYLPIDDVLKYERDMSYPTAVYQAGVVLYHLLTNGNYPNTFFGPGEYENMPNLSVYNTSPINDMGYPQALTDLVQRMCAKDDEQRPTFTECRDVILQVMQDNPHLQLRKTA